MKNKYETGELDKYRNRNYDWEKVFKDLKKVVLGKMKMTNDLYTVMYLRFTIAHYNMLGWMLEYNGNWAALANVVNPTAYGDFLKPDSKPFDDIRKFLRHHDDNVVDLSYLY